MVESILLALRSLQSLRAYMAAILQTAGFWVVIVPSIVFFVLDYYVRPNCSECASWEFHMSAEMIVDLFVLAMLLGGLTAFHSLSSDLAAARGELADVPNSEMITVDEVDAGGSHRRLLIPSSTTPSRISAVMRRQGTSVSTTDQPLVTGELIPRSELPSAPVRPSESSAAALESPDPEGPPGSPS